MTKRLFVAWLCWLALVASAGASGGAPEGMQKPGVTADLTAGRAFVAVLIDRRDKQLLASEAYADWQAYAARFESQARGHLPVHMLAPAQARRLLQRLPRDVGNATLFVAADGQALLHRGLVLEPEVYRIGRAFAEGGGPSAEAAAYGLLPLALK